MIVVNVVKMANDINVAMLGNTDSVIHVGKHIDHRIRISNLFSTFFLVAFSGFALFQTFTDGCNEVVGDVVDRL